MEKIFDRWNEYGKAQCVKDEKMRKIVLTLLQQCKDEGLTVSDVRRICEMATSAALDTTL